MLVRISVGVMEAYRHMEGITVTTADARVAR